MLCEARNNAGLTQTDLALRLGKLQAYVSKYERRERRLDLVEFLDVADALRLDPHQVIRRIRRHAKDES